MQPRAQAGHGRAGDARDGKAAHVVYNVLDSATQTQDSPLDSLTVRRERVQLLSLSLNLTQDCPLPLPSLHLSHKALVDRVQRPSHSPFSSSPCPIPSTSTSHLSPFFYQPRIRPLALSTQLVRLPLGHQRRLNTSSGARIRPNCKSRRAALDRQKRNRPPSRLRGRGAPHTALTRIT